MCRSRSTQQSRALGEAFYRCRGDIIRTLHQDISEKVNQTSDVVLAGVMALLLSDVSRRLLLGELDILYIFSVHSNYCQIGSAL